MKKTLILVSGKMQSGKNTFADIVGDLLKTNYSVRYDLFAQSLKDGVWKDFYSLHTFIYQQYWKLPKEIRPQFEWMFIKQDDFYEKKTPYGRLLCQIYGTEIFRDKVDELYWVKTVEKRFNEQSEDLCIVTDVRFPNEIEYFRSLGYNVITVRVSRNGKKDGAFNEEHFSEKALDDYSEFDWNIDNSGSLEELKEKALNFCNSIEDKNAVL